MNTVGLKEARILSVLLSKEKYGLEIVESLKKETGEGTPLSGLYPTLHRLEKKGFIKGRWGESTAERGGNRRRYYRLTGSGEKALKEVRISLTPLWDWKPQQANFGFLRINSHQINFWNWEVLGV